MHYKFCIILHNCMIFEIPEIRQLQKIQLAIHSKPI